MANHQVGAGGASEISSRRLSHGQNRNRHDGSNRPSLPRAERSSSSGGGNNNRAKKIKTKKVGRGVGRGLLRLFDNGRTASKNENRGPGGVGRGGSGRSSRNSRGQSAGEASSASSSAKRRTAARTSKSGKKRPSRRSSGRGASAELKSTRSAATPAGRGGGKGRGIGDEVSTESAQLSALLHEITDGLDGTTSNTLDTPRSLGEENTIIASAGGETETIWR